MKKHDNQVAQFGKYKGKLITWIYEHDPDYVRWLARESNSCTKSKRAAQSILDRNKPKL